MIYYLPLDGRPCTPALNVKEQLLYYLVTYQDKVRLLSRGTYALLPPSAFRMAMAEVDADGKGAITAQLILANGQVVVPPKIHLPADTLCVAIIDVATGHPLLYGIVCYVEAEASELEHS